MPATKLQTGQRFPIVSGGKIGLKIGLNIVCCVASLRLCCVVFPAGVVPASCQKCLTFLHMHTSDCAGTHTGFDREMCQGCAGVRLAENNNRRGKCEKKKKMMPLTYAIPVFLLWHMNCCYRTVSHFLGSAITFLAVSFFSLRNTLYECRDFKNRTRPN